MIKNKPRPKKNTLERINHIVLDEEWRLLDSERKTLANLNKIMKRHNVSIPKKLIAKEKIDKDIYLNKLGYYVRKNAAINSIRQIDSLFFNYKYAKQYVNQILKDAYSYKKSALDISSARRDRGFSSVFYYKEYDILYRNLKEIHNEISLKYSSNPSKKQLDLFDAFYPDPHLKKEIVEVQCEFLKSYEKLIKEIYTPTRTGITNDRTSSAIGYGITNKLFSLEKYYSLKTISVLRDVVSYTKGHKNKLRILEQITNIISVKKNIKPQELSMIGKIVSPFSIDSKKFNNALELLDALFERYKSKITYAEKNDTLNYGRKRTTAVEQALEKRSLFNLLKNINEYISFSKNPEERYLKFEKFINTYNRLKTIYNPDIILERLK